MTHKAPGSFKTLGAMLRESCEQWRAKTAMLVPDGRDFREISYGELWNLVRGFAGAIDSLGMKPGDRLAIQSENCVQWALTDWACQTLGVTVVPIYPTLPKDQASYIVRDSGAMLVLAGSLEQAQKHSGIQGVRVMGLTGAESLEALAATHINRISNEELNARIDAVDPHAVATIIYTSGTTGNPKGAMIPHLAPVYVCEHIRASLPIDESDTFLTFLPMSHVFERVAGQFLPVSCGATIGYAKSLMSLAGDIQSVRPTIMLCVPRFLEATRDKILDAVKKYPPIRKWLFGVALSQGIIKARGGFAPLYGLLDPLVGKKIRDRMGGRMRFMVSGGAALPQHVAEFYIAFGLEIVQGYGLTETTAATCVNPPGKSKYWTVGPPIEGVEVKIAEDGEICVRGPSVMLGYHNLPKETHEAVDADGWFHTGDIGEWEGEYLKITDRKKDLLILANGKNVAPQPIENKLRESPFISEVVLFGDGNEYVYGLVVPNFERLGKELESLGVVGASHSELLAHAKVREILKSEVDRVNKTLADFEKVKKWAPVDAVFSVDSGELTPTLKVKRKVVRERYASVLKDLERG